MGVLGDQRREKKRGGDHSCALGWRRGGEGRRTFRRALHPSERKKKKKKKLRAFYRALEQNKARKGKRGVWQKIEKRNWGDTIALR